MKHLATLLIGLVAVTGASAQSAGTWSAKAGYNQFYPQVKSGDITGVPGGKVDVGDGGGVFASAAYMVDDHFSAELAFGVPPKLDIGGRGSIAAAGKIADTKVWSPILMIQYRFGRTEAALRPYAGIGATYTKYTSVSTTPVLSMLTNPGGHTSADIDNAWGAVATRGHVQFGQQLVHRRLGRADAREDHRAPFDRAERRRQRQSRVGQSRGRVQVLTRPGIEGGSHGHR